MKRCRLPFLLLMATPFLALQAHSETEQIDLKALAKKARPAVMLLVVSDANGKEIATGTGFLVSSDGKLITNHHVIEGAASVVAKAENGGLFPVEGVLADDPKNDVVLLKLTGKELPFLSFGTNATVEVGTRVAVVGSPLGLEGTLSEGIVSGERELMGDVKKLQISAAISPGSSGSPVMNAKGDVVGVASALLRGGQSLNFAVPAVVARLLLAKGAGTSPPKSLSSETDVVVAGDIFDLIGNEDYRASSEAMKNGDCAEALKRIKNVLGKFPESADAHVQLGRVYASMKFDDEATAAFEEAKKILKQRIKKKPNDDLAWSSLGELYETQGKGEDAIAAYRQAVQITPFPGQWCDLGLACIDQHKYADAISALREAIKVVAGKFPNDPAPAGMYWDYLGEAYSGARNWDAAIDAFNHAIKLLKKPSMSWHGLAVVYSNTGQKDKAKEALLELEKLDSERARELATVLGVQLH